MRTIVIVGAGFSGTVTALQVLRKSRGPLKLILLNRHAGFGRGVAYGTRSALHVLNVPAGRMGALAENEGDFLAWLQARDPGATGGMFMPRALFGAYLEARLLETVDRAAPGVTFDHRQGEAMGLSRDGERWQAQLRDGASLTCDEVVIACGNYPPASAPGAVPGLAEHPAFLPDPWNAAAWERLPEEGEVLLIGTGLTMVDAALQVAAQRPGLRMTAVSRRGLLPFPHRDHGPPPPPDISLMDELTPGRSPRQLLRSMRRWLRTHPDTDWRDILVWLRPVTPALWQAWDEQGKRRFLRHLRPWWDVHRHRMAPDIYRGLKALIDSSRLCVSRARVRSLAPAGEGITAELSSRGRTEQRVFAAVINCTGPETRLAHAPDPLLRALLAKGLIKPDALGLGLETDDQYRVRDARGEPVPGVRYIGPLLRARWWEATAVPELRVHAARLAESIVST